MISKTVLQAPERSPRGPEICAAIAACIALLALLGWVSGVRFLAGELGIYIPMAPSTALAFLLLSGALYSFVRVPALRPARLFELTVVSIVLLLGSLVLAQFIFGVDFGIERVLSRTNELLGSTPLGRMSLLTAIAFLLEGAALFILLIGERWRNVPTTVALLAAGAAGINTVVLIGYAFGAPLLYGGTTIPVALPTALAFVLVGMGQIILAAPGIPALREWSSASMRGILLRAFLPFLLLYIFLDSWADQAIAPMMNMNPAVWYSLKLLSAGVLIVLTIGWIARRTGGEIERAQKALAESEARYRSLFENMLSGYAHCQMIFKDGKPQDFIYLGVNDAFEKLTGMKDVAGKKVSEVISGVQESNPELFEIYGRVALTGQPEKFETHIASLGIWFSISVYSPQPEHFVAVFENITDRKQAERALFESEARVRHLFTTSPDAILLIDPHDPVISWPIVDCNEAACQINGYAREDLIGQSIDILNVAAGTKEERDAYLNRLRHEGVIHIESLHRHKDGHTFPVDVSTSLSAFEGRELVIGIDRDITERNHAKKALEGHVKQLTVLHEIAVLSTQVDTIDRLIESTTEIIGKNLFPDNFGILLLDEEKGVMHAHPSYRFVSKNELFAGDVLLGQGVTGQVAQTGQPVRIGNVEGLNNYINIDPRTASELCVPIRLKERVLGVINVESTKTEAFSLDDELLLGTLAGQLATAIEQLRAAQAERQWLDQLAHSNELIYAIAHITAHIEKALTQEEIIQTLGRELHKIDLTCSLATFDQKRARFTINYTSMQPIVLDQMENSLGFPLINHHFSLERLNTILNHADIQHPAAVANPEKEIQVLFPRRREKGISEILHGIGVTCETEPLRLPLVFEEHLLGILWVWGQGITKADLPIMSIFAKQIGSSLERAHLFQEVQSLALTDPLTGLQNRRSLFELGRIEFARSIRTKRPFCCMMLDVDHFKQINDNYGHLAGDQVLRDFAQRCKNLVREVDIIGRYGGEELVIFLPETDLDTAVHVAERLRSTIEKTPIKVSGRDLHVTISIGVAAKDENTQELQTLIARADQAMYIAKYKGRNRVSTSK